MPCLLLLFRLLYVPLVVLLVVVGVDLGVLLVLHVQRLLPLRLGVLFGFADDVNVARLVLVQSFNFRKLQNSENSSAVQYTARSAEGRST